MKTSQVITKQLAIISDKDMEDIVRPDSNFAKHASFLFPHPKAEGLDKPRRKEWEVTLLNEEQGLASIRVEPSTAHHCPTTKTEDVYYALINLWLFNGKPLAPFYTSMTEICKVLELPANGRNIKMVEEELNILLKTNISWTLSYKVDTGLHTVKNQQILDTFDYSSMNERPDSSNKFDKTCIVRFHNKILANLLANRTIPVNFKTRKSISSSTSKSLYGHVDKILYSTKRPYSRTIYNLVNDLYLKPERYKYKSQRKVLAEKYVASLNGKSLSNGDILQVKAEVTADDSDWKLTFSARKSKILSSPIRKIKVINTDEDEIEDLINHIGEVVGSVKTNKRLYKLYATHYSRNAIYRATGEYKERLEAKGIKTKPAMFTAILHRIIHELKYEWIKDCTEKGNKVCKYNSGMVF